MLENPRSAVGNPTSALGPSGSSFGPSSLAPIGIHHLLLSNLTTGFTYKMAAKPAGIDMERNYVTVTLRVLTSRMSRL